MKNNDRWSQLSMQQRADFFKKAIELGITDRKAIIDTYNSFDDGGVIDTSKPLLSREDYLNEQRQNIIKTALEKSYSRINPDVPKRLKYANEKSWRDILEAKIEYNKNLIRSYNVDDLFNDDNLSEKKRLLDENALLEKELLNGYKEEYIDGASCIYTATGNFGDKYKCSWNVWFNENPKKYGFEEVNLKDVAPGDIIQDFTNAEGIPNHALTFIGYDDSGKAKYNYSSGGGDSKAIKKQAYYPYELDNGQFIHFTKDNYDDLKTAIAAYRFIGTEDDNNLWNQDYNNYRSEYGKNVVRQLQNVPELPKAKVEYKDTSSIKKAYGGRILDGTSEENQTTTNKPVGAGLATYNHPLYNHEEEAKIYSYLRDRGVKHTQAAAIMGNIAVESMLDPEISQIGGGGGYGLIQATDKTRKNAFINYDGQPYVFGTGLNPETQRQLDYIIDNGLDKQVRGEWRGNHNIGRANKARQRFLEATDVDKASKIFTENYLRPGKPHTKRRTSMSRYFNENYGELERQLNAFSDAFLFK